MAIFTFDLNDMKIGVITYNAPHRKTQDLVYRLLLNGYNDITLIALPWEEREKHKPIYPHRPFGCENVFPQNLCHLLKLRFIYIGFLSNASFKEVSDKEKFDFILIGGSGILPENAYDNFCIINSHPGYLPNVKGLDALKWAIYEGQPIGATTHIINDKTDEGILIERQIVPVYFEDSFHSVAVRLYETEIDMLVNSINLLKDADINKLEKLDDPHYPVIHKRMPLYKEIIMMQKFEEIRKNSKSYRD